MSIPLIVFGALFLIAGSFLTFRPATVARLDQAQQRAFLGHQTAATRYRPVAQRIAGAIPLVAGVVLIVVGVLQH